MVGGFTATYSSILVFLVFPQFLKACIRIAVSFESRIDWTYPLAIVNKRTNGNIM
jgi:hypothetical protein